MTGPRLPRVSLHGFTEGECALLEQPETECALCGAPAPSGLCAGCEEGLVAAHRYHLRHRYLNEEIFR